MNNIEKLNILTLENGDYIVLEILEENNKTYYFLNKIDENEELEEEIKICYLAKSNEKIGLVEIEDQNELDEIREIFIPMLEVDYE